MGLRFIAWFLSFFSANWRNWRLGRLFEERHDAPFAIEAYAQAGSSTDLVRYGDVLETEAQRLRSVDTYFHAIVAYDKAGAKESLRRAIDDVLSLCTFFDTRYEPDDMVPYRDDHQKLCEIINICNRNGILTKDIALSAANRYLQLFEASFAPDRSCMESVAKLYALAETPLPKERLRAQARKELKRSASFGCGHAKQICEFLGETLQAADVMDALRDMLENRRAQDILVLLLQSGDFLTKSQLAETLSALAEKEIPLPCGMFGSYLAACELAGIQPPPGYLLQVADHYKEKSANGDAAMAYAELIKQSGLRDQILKPQEA